VTKEETHNGWRNYPTWVVNLWLSNDEGLYRALEERVEAYVGLGRPTNELAGSIKFWVVEDLVPDLGASFAADLLGFALDQVDWLEIAEAWASDVEEVRS
jgi:hypothetical protein